MTQAHDGNIQRVMDILVQLDHMDDWTRGFGATVDELKPFERDALREVASEIVAVVQMADQGCESHDDFLRRVSAIAENFYSSTPYDDMAKNAWLNVVKALYPPIAKHAQEHVIPESFEVGDPT